VGGEPAQAQDMSDPSLDRVFTGFDFKFFVQFWKPGGVQAEIAARNVVCAAVSKEVLKSRDRMGTMRAKPLDGDYGNLSEAEERLGPRRTI
jgi:hypothetical protein